MTSIRDTAVGQLLGLVGFQRYCLYRDEVAHFVPSVLDTSEEVVLVGWIGQKDDANPRNWSRIKKLWVTFVICAYTFVVYCASAIFVPSFPYIMEQYDVSTEVASLGLSIYIAGYATGPMLFSPLSEIVYIGRNPPYWISFIGFLVISIALAVPTNLSFTAIIVLRFLQGFFGSPILASGGASLEDIFDRRSAQYAFIFWIAAIYCGPGVGPLLSVFAVPIDWRWSLREIMIMAGIIAFLMLPFLPETLPSNILFHRAKRLRVATGDSRYRCAAELVKIDLNALVVDALIKPVEIVIKDPAIAFVCVYVTLMYLIYYSFFEAFPLVYTGIYNMSQASTALVFLSIVIGCLTSSCIYAFYLYLVFYPLTERQEMPPEACLRASLPAVFSLTMGLFIFAWTSRADIHWIWSATGIAIYAASSFVLFQCAVYYLTLTYPNYVASLFASNDFVRSMFAGGMVMVSRPMYLRLGIGKGVSILGAFSIIGIFGMFYLYFYGSKLRAKSRFAV